MSITQQVKEAQSGSRAAFGALYESLAGDLYRMALYTLGFLAFVLLMALFEQMGLPRKAIGVGFLLATVAVYAGIGMGSRTTVPVDYYVRDNGGWKIFDVAVEGVSYVQTFRGQFDAPLRQKPIAQVAAELRSGALQTAPTNGGR